MIRLTAGVSPQAGIGAGTCVWREAQVREEAAVGRNSILHKGVC
jgi:UDP-3-O-[3-hydroxymyristoyl] glucosamine N-acyltransferase